MSSIQLRSRSKTNANASIETNPPVKNKRFSTMLETEAKKVNQKKSIDIEIDTEKLIWDVKMEINNYYDDVKANLDFNCQSVLCKREKAKKSNKALTKKYLSWIAIIETCQNTVMDEFKKFSEDKSNIANKSKEELIKLFVKSIVYVPEEDVNRSKYCWEEDDDDDNENKIDNVGVFINCSWYLSESQLSYIKINSSLVKERLCEDAKLCLDESLIKVHLASNGVFIDDESERIFSDCYRLEEPSLIDVKVLSLQNCMSISSLNSDCFSKLENLLELDLSFNKLESLKANTFKDLKSLLCLKLVNCDLRSIDLNSFAKMENLLVLFLSQNTELKSFKPKIFKDLKSLRCLHLDNCYSISAFHNDVFFGLENLEELSLSGNGSLNLKASDLKELKALKNFDLHGCDFELIEDGFFSKFEKLEKLNLCSSNIDVWIKNQQSIGFRGLNSLLSLNLSCCGLESKDLSYFSHLVNLEKLNLENNDLNDLEPKLFADFKKLNLLVFDENQVTYKNGKKITRAKFKKEMQALIDSSIEVVFDENYWDNLD